MKMGQGLFAVLLLVWLAIWCQAEKPEYCNEDPEQGYDCGDGREGKRYYYSPRAQYCIGFYYYGCYGNENNFRYRSTCESICGLTQAEKCRLPVDHGRMRCHGSDEVSKRFYFNEETGSCEEFDFTCSGNDNNFRTQEECTQLCAPATFYSIDEDSPCLTPLPHGRCRTRRDKYTFDITTGDCEYAYRYGCADSGNLFDDYNDCMDTCNPNWLWPKRGQEQENY